MSCMCCYPVCKVTWLTDHSINTETRESQMHRAVCLLKIRSHYFKCICPHIQGINVLICSVQPQKRNTHEEASHRKTQGGSPLHAVFIFLLSSLNRHIQCWLIYNIEIIINVDVDIRWKKLSLTQQSSSLINN